MAYTGFKDRVVSHPGRVIMTPVQGEANTYDMSRAEGTVTEAGTPFNAATFNGIADDIIQIAGDNIITDAELTALEQKLDTGSDRLQDLLDKIITMDSRDIPITVSGISANYTVYKTYNTASLSFLFGTGTAFSSLTGSDIIGTLPEGYRPKGGRYFPAVAKDAGAWGTAKYYDALVAIDQNGTISLRGNSTNLKTCKYLMASLVWML